MTTKEWVVFTAMAFLAVGWPLVTVWLYRDEYREMRRKCQVCGHRDDEHWKGRCLRLALTRHQCRCPGLKLIDEEDT